MVCWVSTEKRKQEAKSSMADAQGTKLSLALFSASKSPCCRKVRYHARAKASQLRKKPAAKRRKIQHQLRSRMLMKRSLKSRWDLPSAREGGETVLISPRFCTTLLRADCLTSTPIRPVSRLRNGFLVFLHGYIMLRNS